jgi:hypothetical protein
MTPVIGLMALTQTSIQLKQKMASTARVMAREFTGAGVAVMMFCAVVKT